MRSHASLLVVLSTWAFVNTVSAVQEITVQAGDKATPAGPMSFMPAKPLPADEAYTVKLSCGHELAGQTDADGRLWWWSLGVGADQILTCTVQSAAAAAVKDRVKVEKAGDGVINVTIDGKPFTTFNYKKDEPKVYLYPVIGPTGEPVTRDFPMKDNPLEKDNKRQDHHHHRSLWTAHGDIRVGDFSKPGADFWAEPKGKPLTDQAVTKITRMVSGPVFGQITADIDWIDAAGKKYFSETRTYTFFAGNEDERIVDQKNVFNFDQGDVMFGDTKEGGIVSLRLAVTMDEDGVKTPEALSGQMTNSRGGKTAKECWGKQAEWCDYVGPVKGEQIGVAVLDHPTNFRHPAYWHIRNYGLYTANPFGIQAFTGDKSKNGSHVFKKGEQAVFNYRVIIHKGDTQAAGIADQFALYAHPQKVSGK